MTVRTVKFFPFVILILVILLSGKGEGQGIGADPESLMKIIRALCGSPHDEKFAQEFYQCYSLLPESEKCIFDRCQKEAFGCPLNTKKNIEYSCTVPEKLPVYTNCLMQSMQTCGLDVVKAVTTINVCQGTLLGLVQPSSPSNNFAFY